MGITKNRNLAKKGLKGCKKGHNRVTDVFKGGRLTHPKGDDGTPDVGCCAGVFEKGSEAGWRGEDVERRCLTLRMNRRRNVEKGSDAGRQRATPHLTDEFDGVGLEERGLGTAQAQRGEDNLCVCKTTCMGERRMTTLRRQAEGGGQDLYVCMYMCVWVNEEQRK